MKLTVFLVQICTMQIQERTWVKNLPRMTSRTKPLTLFLVKYHSTMSPCYSFRSGGGQSGLCLSPDMAMLPSQVGNIDSLTSLLSGTISRSKKNTVPKGSSARSWTLELQQEKGGDNWNGYQEPNRELNVACLGLETLLGEWGRTSIVPEERLNPWSSVAFWKRIGNKK